VAEDIGTVRRLLTCRPNRTTNTYSFSFAQHTGYVLTATINPSDILVISATVIIVSVIASLQPAYKASKMEPIKALRHV